MEAHFSERQVELQLKGKSAKKIAIDSEFV